MHIRVDWLILLFVPLAYLTDSAVLDVFATIAVWVANITMGIILVVLVVNAKNLSVRRVPTTAKRLAGAAWMAATIAVLAYTGWVASAWFISVCWLITSAILYRKV